MTAVLAIAGLLLKEVFRKKDFYVTIILTAAIVAYAASLRFYDAAKVSRYLMDLGLALVFWGSAVVTVSLSARQYPDERERRTLLVLFSKPVTRFQFAAGKTLGSFAAGGASFLIFYGGFLAFAESRAGGVEAASAVQGAWLFLVNLLVLASLAHFFSYHLTAAANVTLTLLVYLLMNAFGSSLAESAEALPLAGRLAAGVLYRIAPHFEFFDVRDRLVHAWGPLPLKTMAVVTAYGLAHAAAYLGASWLSLRRRTL